MIRRFARPIWAAVILPLLVLAPTVLPATATAHEQHGEGDLTMVVGFGTEPAYAGQPNSVQLVLEHDGEPVTDLGNTLDVEVGFGDQSMALELEPFFGPGFGTPGDYRAWFIPSTPGRYSFHLSGQIEGEGVDETFTSGPDTFSDVLDPSELTFPEANVPSTADLATRIERETARLGDEIRAVRDSTSDQTEAVARADGAADDAASARTLGLVGVGVGALGLMVAAMALVFARRRTA